MLVQFGNNWIKKIPLTAKLDEAIILAVLGIFFIQLFPFGEHVVLLNIKSHIYGKCQIQVENFSE